MFLERRYQYMKIIKKDGNSIMMKSETGIDIKLIFKEDDNPEHIHLLQMQYQVVVILHLMNLALYKF